jgi:hypothetical protein
MGRSLRILPDEHSASTNHRSFRQVTVVAARRRMPKTSGFLMRSKRREDGDVAVVATVVAEISDSFWEHR